MGDTSRMTSATKEFPAAQDCDISPRGHLLVTRKWGLLVWMGGVLCATLTVGLLVLHLLGRGRWGVTIAAQSTARIAFGYFWLSYTAGALVAFLGPSVAVLARHRRDFGLAFAAALSVHLLFVAYLFHISFYRPVSNVVILYFGVGAFWTYALALGSLPSVRDLRGNRFWKIFSTIGIEYIAFLFFCDFVLLPLQYGTLHPLFYLPFAILSIVGSLMRWGAIMWRTHPEPICTGTQPTIAERSKFFTEGQA